MEVMDELIMVVTEKVLLVRSPQHRRGGEEEKVREVIRRVGKASHGQVDQDTRDGSVGIWMVPLTNMVQVQKLNFCQNELT